MGDRPARRPAGETQPFLEVEIVHLVDDAVDVIREIRALGGEIAMEGERRLDAMVRTTDGFKIAELDLELRGWGEIAGTRQAGAPSFRVANPIRDRQLLEAAKREAAALVSGPPPDITPEEVARGMTHLKAHWQRRYGLVEVG